MAQIQIRSTGELRDKRTITVSDDSGVSIMATLWGEIAGDEKITVGQIIAAKGVKVSEYGGKSLNIDSGCVLEFSPQEEERFHQLSFWYSK